MKGDWLLLSLPWDEEAFTDEEKEENTRLIVVLPIPMSVTVRM